MSIRLMLAFSNMLFSEGIGKILGNEKDITIAEILKTGVPCTPEKLSALNPDVILTDFTALYNAFPNIESAEKKYNFVLFDTDCGRNNIVSAILHKNVSGVLMGHANASHLRKSIRAVANGELWIDNGTVKSLLLGMNTINKSKTATLSVKEKELTSLIVQGFRNKEVANKLNIGEATVKSHLHRIFQKLDITNRSQLITYYIKNNDVGNIYDNVQ